MWSFLGLAISVGGYFAADRIAGLLVVFYRLLWRDKGEWN